MNTASRPTRILALDLARTLAVVCMVIFHFTFDLQMFGHIAPDSTGQPFWHYFARLTAGSFLFLAGVSLWLAHGRGIRWPAFWRRFAIVAAAAALISVASFWVTPNGPILFGILHAIALSSLITMAFLSVSPLITLTLAGIVFALPWLVQGPSFEGLWLLWLGLGVARPAMSDYVPLLPWLAPCLAGLACAKAATQHDFWHHLSGWPVLSPRIINWLTFPGRHSLIVYLAHQPVMIAGFYILAMIRHSAP